MDSKCSLRQELESFLANSLASSLIDKALKIDNCIVLASYNHTLEKTVDDARIEAVREYGISKNEGKLPYGFSRFGAHKELQFWKDKNPRIRLCAIEELYVKSLSDDTRDVLEGEVYRVTDYTPIDLNLLQQGNYDSELEKIASHPKPIDLEIRKKVKKSLLYSLEKRVYKEVYANIGFSIEKFKSEWPNIYQNESIYPYELQKDLTWENLDLFEKKQETFSGNIVKLINFAVKKYGVQKMNKIKYHLIPNHPLFRFSNELTWLKDEDFQKLYESEFDPLSFHNRLKSIMQAENKREISNFIFSAGCIALAPLGILAGIVALSVLAGSWGIYRTYNLFKGKVVKNK